MKARNADGGCILDVRLTVHLGRTGGRGRGEMLSINVDSRQAWMKEVLLHLTWSEFEILVLLSSVPMRCFSKIEITRYLWGRDYFHDAHTIESHISRLRKKLGAIDSDRTWISTVRMSGYRLENPADVEVVTFPRNPRALFEVWNAFSDHALLRLPTSHDDVRGRVPHRHLDRAVMHKAR